MDSNQPREFSLEEYAEYLTAPQWQRDGFESPSGYHSYWCDTIKKMHDEAYEDSKTERGVWDVCYQKIDEAGKKNVTLAAGESTIAAAQIPILKNAMLDDVASLYSGQYQPILKALQEPLQPMIAMANQFLKAELMLNDFDTLKFDLGVDGFVTDMWILKLYTSDDKASPFSDEQRIVLERIRPKNFFVDPKAPRFEWSLMDYCGISESLDIGVVRKRFPEQAELITSALFQADTEEERRAAGTALFIMPGARSRWNSASDRQRIQLKEWWLHDERYQFRAEQIDTPEGMKVKVDEKTGKVVGKWEPAYPAGRMFVTAADKLVLRDCPNPYWHDDLPFIVCQQDPSVERLVNVGKAASVLGIDRKINDCETREHSYAQSEIERPMEADVGTFPDNMQLYKTTGQSRRIIVKNVGRNFIRRPPVETPAFVPVYLGRMERYLNQTVGQSGILKGDMPEGSQMAAGTIQAVQGNSTTRLGMQSVYIAAAFRKLGYRMFALQRETYKEGLEATIMSPNGSPDVVKWDQKKFGNAYLVDVDLQANTPGGRAAAGTRAMEMYREGMCDLPYAWQAMNIEGWEQMQTRMKQDQLTKITAAAYGRGMSISVKQFEKPSGERGQTKRAGA